MTMVGALSVTPVRKSHQGRPLSKLNSFDQNFMKLDHIGKHHNVFFKFGNVPYRTMSPGVIALCS